MNFLQKLRIFTHNSMKVSFFPKDSGGTDLSFDVTTAFSGSYFRNNFLLEGSCWHSCWDLILVILMLRAPDLVLSGPNRARRL